jgi:hypothetical protein
VADPVVLYVPATTSVPTTNVPSPKLLAGPDCVGGGVGCGVSGGCVACSVTWVVCSAVAASVLQIACCRCRHYRSRWN